MEDFLIKAEALNLAVDFSKKWGTFRLLDEPQVKNTRGRSLVKHDPERYNYERMNEQLKKNTEQFSVEEVSQRYEEIVTKQENDFDYQITLEDWQIDHKTSRGYYLNVDFGYNNHGQLFIGAYKVDPLENGNYHLFVRQKDYFYFMNDTNSERNRYMTGETLIKQLQLYNGTVPLKKEPIMSTIDELVHAINFLAEHEITEGRQLNHLENKLEEAFIEAENSLTALDEKIMELNQLGKLFLEAETIEDKEDIQKKVNHLIPGTLDEITFKDIQAEISSVSLRQKLLKEKLEQTTKQMNHLHEIQAITKKENTKLTLPKL